MKGLFIPGITAEIFRNGCLEGIETLMAEGEIYDIEYSQWIPVSERLPNHDGQYLVTTTNGDIARFVFHEDGNSREYWKRCVIAWMPLPEPYKAESEEKDGNK